MPPAVPENPPVRRRVCYSSKKPKKGDKVGETQWILENETHWIVIYRNKNIESAIFCQRIKFFSWIIGFCFNIFLLAEVLLGHLPAIILLGEAFGLLVLVSVFPNLRRSTRIVHEIYVDADEIFVKARYVIPWGVLRNRYAAKADINLLGSGILLNSGKTDSKNGSLKWKERDWKTSLQIPTTNFEILDFQRAQNLFSDFNLTD